MQVVLERFLSAAFVLLACLLFPVQAGGYEANSNSNSDAASSVTVTQQTRQVRQSDETTSSELPMSFAARFVKSCTSDRAGDKAFFLSRIRSPLKYTFSFIDERGKQSTQGTLFEIRKNPETGGLSLPLCIGDGGLDETNIRVDWKILKIELIFGSGPNEELHFKKVTGKWKLIFVEWIDH